MKKIILLLIAFLIGGYGVGQENTAQNMRMIRLENGDFAIPSEIGIVGWNCHNRDWPGKLEIKDDENGGKYLSVTPLKSPTQLDTKNEPQISALVFSGTKFNAAVGDKMILKFQIRTSAESSGYLILDNDRDSQWLPSLKTASPVAGQWCDYIVEYTIKETANKQQRGKYSLRFQISGSPVDIRPISLSIQSNSK